jgi:transaldolase
VLHNNTYLSWVTNHTRTKWWHDSAEPSELQRGLERGAVGVTTNPFLTNLALSKNRDAWAAEIAEVLSAHLPPEAKAESLMRIPVTRAAGQLLPEYERSRGRMGYVCAQVNPARAGDRDAMLAMAKRFHAWAPNMAVKLPATAAGLDVLEECIAQGITITATVSFTLPQAIAIAERCRQGVGRARSSGLEPGRCFAVIMIGRLDDYLREVAHDSRAGIPESDIRQAGLAVTKRAYAIYKERGYEAVLLVAALRGDYHLTELAGADLVMSIAPAYQELFVSRDLPREERIQAEVQAEVVERLSRLPEFVRSYAPDGMLPEDFITYGVTQRTLAQFYDAGWKLLETWGML